MEAVTVAMRTAAQFCAAAVRIVLMTGSLLAVQNKAAAGDVAPEYAVKAAYLSKLGLFIQWPESAFASPTSAVVLCVVGQNPFGDTLDKVVEGQRVGEHPLTVRYLKAVTRDSGCDILYVAGPNAQSVSAALGAVQGTGVLTVTDAAIGDHAAGIVDFVVQNNRVQFNIDEQAAAQNGITISSHLLSLALAVRSRN